MEKMDYENGQRFEAMEIDLSDEESPLNRLNRIFEQEESEMMTALQDLLDDVSFPMTDVEEMQLREQDVRYRDDHPYKNIEAKTNQIESMKQEMYRRGTDLIRSILNRQDVENIRQFDPDIREEMEKDIIRLIQLDFLTWLYDDFISETDCAFCFLRFLSNVSAREHIETHFYDLAVNAVNDILK